MQKNRKERVDCEHTGYYLQLIAKYGRSLHNVYVGRAGHLRVRDAVGLEQTKERPW